jgi:glycosyltransferase involved in cell wall biosynthesis
MKTLQIGMGWFPEQAGGLNRFYYDCTHYLPQAGVEIDGLVAGSAQVSAMTQGQVQSFADRTSSLLNRWQGVRRQARQLLQQQSYAPVVSHFALYTLPILDLLGDRPLVMHFQGPWALEGQVEGGKSLSTRFKKVVEQLSYRRVAQFIVLSEAFKNILHREYGVDRDRIHVIPAAVDLDRFNLTMSQAEARQKLGWDCDRPIIFAARRLAKRMGLENLIEAMARVKQTHPDAMLMIAGKGAMAEALQTQIDQLGLADQVKLLGYVPDEDLLLAYRAANFSVVPTVAYEGFGLIIIESLAAGTPVLGTPVDSIPEILSPFCQDCLFESASSQDLAQGITEVLSGVRQLPTAEQCRDYVATHYAWPTIAQRIRSVYELAIVES